MPTDLENKLANLRRRLLEVLADLDAATRAVSATAVIASTTERELELVTREQWGARSPAARSVSHVPSSIVVHHSSQPDARQYTGAASVRGIQAFHIDTRGWADIGYHFLIAPDGTVFAGRSPTVIGAHVAGHNTGAIGVCLIGNFEPGADPLPAVQRARLVELLEHLCTAYFISPTSITGHRDHSNTDCPGGTLFGELAAIRLEVSRAHP